MAGRVDRARETTRALEAGGRGRRRARSPRCRAAALALGAGAAFIGTRFVATVESGAPAFYKQALTARDSDATVITDAFTGLYARTLRNAFSEEYAASGAPVLPAVVQQIAAADVTAASARQGSGDYYPMYAGQGVGMIRDLPAAAAVLREIVREAQGVISALAGGPPSA